MKRDIERLRLFGIVFLVPFFCTVLVSAANLRVEVRDSLLEIQAEGVSVGDVLAAVSAKTGLVIKTDTPLTEAVSCSFTGLTLEQGVKKLMTNRGYALMFTEAKGTTSSPSTLWILGTITAEGMTSPSDLTNMLQKEWLAREVENPGQLSRQFSAIPSGPRTEEKGITITNLSSGSVLQKIGLGQGDFISRVNGRSTETPKEFINILQSVPQDASTIMMIERRKPDGRLDPVYVHLE